MSTFQAVVTVAEALLPPGTDFTQFIPAKNCMAGYLLGTVYRVINGQLTAATLPGISSTVVLQAGTEDFKYLVADNKLFRYSDTEGYQLIKTMNSHGHYMLQGNTDSTSARLVLTCANSTANTNPGFTAFNVIDEINYILEDELSTTLVELSSFTV